MFGGHSFWPSRKLIFFYKIYGTENYRMVYSCDICYYQGQYLWSIHISLNFLLRRKQGVSRDDCTKNSKPWMEKCCKMDICLTHVVKHPLCLPRMMAMNKAQGKQWKCMLSSNSYSVFHELCLSVSWFLCFVTWGLIWTGIGLICLYFSSSMIFGTL